MTNALGGSTPATCPADRVEVEPFLFIRDDSLNRAVRWRRMLLEKA